MLSLNLQSLFIYICVFILLGFSRFRMEMMMIVMMMKGKLCFFQILLLCVVFFISFLLLFIVSFTNSSSLIFRTDGEIDEAWVSALPRILIFEKLNKSLYEFSQVFLSGIYIFNALYTTLSSSRNLPSEQENQSKLYSHIQELTCRYLVIY